MSTFDLAAAAAAASTFLSHFGRFNVQLRNDVCWIKYYFLGAQTYNSNVCTMFACCLSISENVCANSSRTPKKKTYSHRLTQHTAFNNLTAPMYDMKIIESFQVKRNEMNWNGSYLSRFYSVEVRMYTNGGRDAKSRPILTFIKSTCTSVVFVWFLSHSKITWQRFQ